MDQFLKLFSNGDQLLVFAGVSLYLFGMLAPKRFFGIEIEWDDKKSVAVVIVGLLLLLIGGVRLFFFR
jgi:hypothetical protein